MSHKYSIVSTSAYRYMYRCVKHGRGVNGGELTNARKQGVNEFYSFGCECGRELQVSGLAK